MEFSMLSSQLSGDEYVDDDGQPLQPMAMDSLHKVRPARAEHVQWYQLQLATSVWTLSLANTWCHRP